MESDRNHEEYVERIASIVGGFVEVWNKFEGMLFDELAKTKGNEGVFSNYGLFYRISSNIYPSNDLTMGELSNALSVPLSTATRMVNWMVTEGTLKRLPDPEDRRIVRVTLTEKGLEMHKAIKSYTEERVGTILSTLSTGEQTMLLELIDKVISALKKVAG
jgi:DNA-binding MarR family transcriptional regulator